MERGLGNVIKRASREFRNSLYQNSFYHITCKKGGLAEQEFLTC